MRRRAPATVPLARVSRFDDLPLLWKLLIPFLALMVAIGVAGAFIIVRDLSSRAQVALDQELTKDTVDAQLAVRDRELYLVESANFASNLEGMATAVRRERVERIAQLMRSVLALKTDLDLVVATDAMGRGIVSFERSSPRSHLHPRTAGDWAGAPFLRDALRDPEGGKSAGFLLAEGRRSLAIAAPVCAGSSTCSAVGAIVVGIRIDEIVDAAFGDLAGAGSDGAGLTVYDPAGRRLVWSGVAASPTPAPFVRTNRLPRRSERSGSVDVETVYAPMIVHGSKVGTLAVTLPRTPVFATVRGAARRFVVILLAAMAGIVGVGFLVSRRILRRVRAILETNHELGRGQLTTRAPATGNDELGELARGVNLMAEQLQASYETLELRVAERTAEVERLMRERTEFFAGLSHDLQTPLSIILHHATLMLDPSYKKDGRWNREAGNAITQSGAQLQILINDILELARAEAGALDLALADVDLHEVIGEARPTIEGLARRSGLRSAVTCPTTLPVVRADRVRVREILVNLVDNAAKYTPQGGSISVSASAHNGVVDVAVNDTGVGIPSEAGDRVFEPFYRVEGIKAQRGESSSGLGLSLVKRFIEAQGGSIRYSSEPGVGTTFTFTLPTAHSVTESGAS